MSAVAVIRRTLTATVHDRERNGALLILGVPTPAASREVGGESSVGFALAAAIPGAAAYCYVPADLPYSGHEGSILLGRPPWPGARFIIRWRPPMSARRARARSFYRRQIAQTCQWASRTRVEGSPPSLSWAKPIFETHCSCWLRTRLRVLVASFRCHRAVVSEMSSIAATSASSIWRCRISRTTSACRGGRALPAASQTLTHRELIIPSDSNLGASICRTS